jgi:hypothetical protein
MIADRVVAWSKRSLYGRNFYLPTDVANTISGVKGVRATFLDHDNRNCLAFSGFDGFMNKFLSNLPAQFTYNYVF